MSKKMQGKIIGNTRKDQNKKTTHSKINMEYFFMS